MRLHRAMLAAALLLLPALAHGQSTQLPKLSKGDGGEEPRVTGAVLLGSDGVEKATTANPLPTAAVVTTVQTCLSATTSGAQTVGPLAPRAGIPITVELSGTTWPGGTAQLLRSSDGGTTKLPLRPADTILGTMTGFGVDQPWAEGVSGAAIPAGVGFWEQFPGAGIGYKLCN